MPGLIGFYKHLDSDQADQLLRNMAHALENDSRFKAELYSSEFVGLGKVSLGLVNPESQPIWSDDGNLCLVMEGEIYDYQEMKQDLVDRDHTFKFDNDAEFALHLYQEYGEDFLTLLNGAFAIAIWHAREKKLLIANDRLGLYPLYYARVGGGLLFASGVRALLADSSLPRCVDRIAMAEFLTFDHMLNDRTMLTDVRLMPQGSVLIFSDNHLRIRPYWKLKYPDIVPFCSEAEYIERLIYFLRLGSKRQMQHDNLPAGLLLSGGLDSRMLLALLCENSKVQTFTWGIKGCDDARYAWEVSKKMEVPHHFFELEPDWLLHQAEEGVRITDGHGNIVNLHALATLKEQTEYAKIIYKGFMGDAMMGYAVQLPFWADYDEPTQSIVHFQSYMNFGVITFLPSEHHRLFTEDFRNDVGDMVMDEMKQGMAASGSSQLANQRLYFDLTQRVPRMTINGVEVVRSRAMVRLPFCDNDLVQFVQTIPPGMQFERHLVTRAFVQAYPQLAKIPYTQTGLPMISCAADIFLRAKQLLQWHLRDAGLGWLAGPADRPYHRYSHWFRTVLRGWIEGILLHPNALERGYFNPDTIRKIVDEHMAGEDHTVQLGALLTLELWHRQFLD